MLKNIFAISVLSILSFSQAHAFCEKGQTCGGGPVVITTGPGSGHPVCRYKCMESAELPSAIHQTIATEMQVDPAQVGTTDFHVEQGASDATNSTYHYMASGTVQTATGAKAFACQGTLATTHEATPGAPETKSEENSSVKCGMN